MTRAKRQLITVIIMTLAGIVFIGMMTALLLFPAFRDVNTLSRDVLDAQTELEAQYTNRKHLLENISEVARIRKTAEDLKGQFIRPGEELTFITRIEELATENGVESSIRLSGAGKKGDGMNDSFDIGLIGTYPNVLAAVRSIERLPNITVIDSVSVRAGDLSEESPTVISASVRGTLAFTPEGL